MSARTAKRGWSTYRKSTTRRAWRSPKGASRMAVADFSSDPRRRREEGRRDRRSAHRRDHGRQKDVGPDPALPSAVAEQGRGRHRARRRPPRASYLRAEARCVGPTGVEMEAPTAVAVACLTVYDMAKAIDRGMIVEADPPRREARRQNRANGAHRSMSDEWHDLGRGSARARACLGRPSPLGEERARARRRAWPRAGARPRRPAHPAALPQFGDGRLCVARRGRGPPPPRR